MKTNIKVFFAWAIFSFMVVTSYWFAAHEPAGAFFLLFMTISPLFIATYFLLKGRNLERAEDQPEASHSAEAGVAVGRFPEGSLWPAVMGLGCAVGVEGFIWGRWLLVLGILLFIAAMIGMTRESHFRTPPPRERPSGPGTPG